MQKNGDSVLKDLGRYELGQMRQRDRLINLIAGKVHLLHQMTDAELRTMYAVVEGVEQRVGGKATR